MLHSEGPWKGGEMEGLVFKDIIYGKKEGVAEISINRPHAFNALTSIWCQDWAFQVAKNMMVVDDDIDIFDVNQLAWAFATRITKIMVVKDSPRSSGLRKRL
jgi:3-polyprenyl-4-hydroxybenzoate decarboxylase